MKDAVHHLKHVQKKVIQSLRKEALTQNNKSTVFAGSNPSLNGANATLNISERKR